MRARLNAPVPSRWYPVKGGHLVKWLHDGSEPGEGCWVEAGGWDHEHCDGCTPTIKVNGTAWVPLRGSFSRLCPYCYRRVVQLRHAGG